MVRWSCAAVVAAVLSGFTFLLVTGRYDNDGPVLVVVSPYHGLHAGDLFVLAGWAVAMVAVVALARRPRADRGVVPRGGPVRPDPSPSSGGPVSTARHRAGPATRG